MSFNADKFVESPEEHLLTLKYAKKSELVALAGVYE